MLHVFFGTDRTKVRDLAADFSEKNLPPNATLTTIDSDTYESGRLADALGAMSLFGGDEWFILDDPANIPDFSEEVTGALRELAESNNTFIVLEGGLLAAAKKKYQTHASSMVESSADKTTTFNMFSLAEAFAARDKKRLWLLLQEATLHGARPEELIGILWWQIKSIRLAQMTDSATEAGMKEFPYTKAKQAAKKFSPNEIETLSRELLELYHAGHAGTRDLSLALERWVLQ